MLDESSDFGIRSVWDWPTVFVDQMQRCEADELRQYRSDCRREIRVDTVEMDLDILQEIEFR